MIDLWIQILTSKVDPTERLQSFWILNIGPELTDGFIYTDSDGDIALLTLLTL